tara:strand:- start:1276 stop:1596 length:321 start_codon:yes stop_codon:yes gene_type:complete
MAVKVLQILSAISDERGVQPLTVYKAGDTFPTDEPWQRTIADSLIRGGMAEETKVVSPSETKTVEPERARNADGTLMGDNKSTPDINEAWVGGEAPKKRGRPKQNN